MVRKLVFWKGHEKLHYMVQKKKIQFFLEKRLYSSLKLKNVAEKLQAINECTDEGKLHEKVANFQERFSMGFNKPTDSMEDKEKLCESITYHNCISVCIEKKAYPRTVRYYLDKANFP